MGLNNMDKLCCFNSQVSFLQLLLNLGFLAFCCTDCMNFYSCGVLLFIYL